MIILSEKLKSLLLDQKTFDQFGYWSKDLSYGSVKKVIHKCEICGKHKETTFKFFIREERLSHNGCSQVKRKQTCKKKYGVENPQQNKEVKEKVKQTCKKKYGVDNPRKSNVVKQKIKNTILERYGVEYASQSEMIKKR